MKVGKWAGVLLASILSVTGFSVESALSGTWLFPDSNPVIEEGQQWFINRIEIFKWVDGKGTIHFTEDSGMIPEKYRARMERRIIEQEPLRSEEKKGEKVLPRREQPEKANGGATFMKDEFEKSVLHKHRDQVINILGQPDSASSPSGYIDEYWHYKGRLVYDPVKKKVCDDIQIRFRYFSKTDLESSSIPEIKDKYPKSDYYAVGIDYSP